MRSAPGLPPAGFTDIAADDALPALLAAPAPSPPPALAAAAPTPAAAAAPAAGGRFGRGL